MKQYPSSLKYRKYHKPGKFYLTGVDNKSFYLHQGSYGLQSIQGGRLNGKQIEAGRKSIRRNISKQGQIYIRVFTGLSITKRPPGVRMGKGKGGHHVWVAAVRAGQVIYEVKGIASHIALMALKLAADKMPLRCKIVKLTY